MFEGYPDVLNVAQLADALGIGRNAAYALLHEGTVKSLRVGRKFLIPKVCLIDYVKSARYNRG